MKISMSKKYGRRILRQRTFGRRDADGLNQESLLIAYTMLGDGYKQLPNVIHAPIRVVRALATNGKMPGGWSGLKPKKRYNRSWRDEY